MLVKQNQGFTLIELMVTIAVLAIIVMAAAPSFGDMMERQQLNSSTQNLVGILSQARAQATLVRSDVQVEILSSQNELNKKYQSVQADAAQKKALEEKRLFLWGPEAKAVLKQDISPITFEMNGTVKGATVDTAIMICNKAQGKKSMTVSISRMGLIQPVTNGECS